MDLERLSVFVAVADTASFSLAAKKLGVPKSTVSRRIARLEQDLGVALLHRTTRHVALTTAGRGLYDRAAPALRALREAAGDLPEQDDEPAGLVRLTAPVDAGTLFLADVLARFVRRHPRVRLDVHLTNRVVDLVGEGFDLALRASHGRMRDSTLVFRRVAMAISRLFAAPAYLANRGTPRSPADLAGHDWVVFRPAPRGLRLEGPGEVFPVTPSGPIVCDDFFFLREALVGGAGIAFASELLVAEDVEAGRLVRVLPAWGIPSGTLSLVWPATRHLPRKVAALRDFVLESLPR